MNERRSGNSKLIVRDGKIVPENPSKLYTQSELDDATLAAALATREQAAQHLPERHSVGYYSCACGFKDDSRSVMIWWPEHIRNLPLPAASVAAAQRRAVLEAGELNGQKMLDEAGIEGTGHSVLWRLAIVLEKLDRMSCGHVKADWVETQTSKPTHVSESGHCRTCAEIRAAVDEQKQLAQIYYDDASEQIAEFPQRIAAAALEVREQAAKVCERTILGGGENDDEYAAGMRADAAAIRSMPLPTNYQQVLEQHDAAVAAETEQRGYEKGREADSLITQAAIETGNYVFCHPETERVVARRLATAIKEALNDAADIAIDQFGAIDVAAAIREHIRNAPLPAPYQQVLEQHDAELQAKLERAQANLETEQRRNLHNASQVAILTNQIAESKESLDRLLAGARRNGFKDAIRRASNRLGWSDATMTKERAVGIVQGTPADALAHPPATLPREPRT